jgi:hypothetical protein
MNDNQKVANFNDKCPVHHTAVKKEYEYGNKMTPSMVVSVFSGCKCACSHREMESTRYHTSFASASGAAILQKQMDCSI